MKKVFAFSFFTLLFFSTIQAQNSDKTLIEDVIKNLYFEGWMTGDTSKVGKAMHTTCHLKYYRDGKFSDISREKYLSGFKLRPKSEGTEGRIISLDITLNIASAKCEIETPKAIFIDYFNLIKVEETWFIVDKISTRKDK